MVNRHRARTWSMTAWSEHVWAALCAGMNVHIIRVVSVQCSWVIQNCEIVAGCFWWINRMFWKYCIALCLALSFFTQMHKKAFGDWAYPYLIGLKSGREGQGRGGREETMGVVRDRILSASVSSAAQLGHCCSSFLCCCSETLELSFTELSNCFIR